MINQELYAPNWAEATKLVGEDFIPAEVGSPESMFRVYTSTLVAIVTDSSMLNREFLSDITGLDLDSNEKLYDYLTKTIEMSPKKALSYGLTLVAQNGDLDIMMTDMGMGALK